MIVYYTNTLFFRAWLLEDVKNQPLDISGLTAEAFIKKSNDSDEVLYHFTVDDYTMQLFQGSNEDGTGLERSWAELNVSELDIPPGDYVFYAYLLFPQKQLLEHCHMLVLNSAETEVTP
jgi:hypothetical protein